MSIAREPCSQGFHDGLVGHAADCTFPDRGDTPAVGAKKSDIPCITLDVFCELAVPEFDVRRWIGRRWTPFVTMPEAALNKHHRPELREDQVRSAWQPSHVQSEPETSGVQRGPNPTLRLGVTSPDARHHPGTGGTINDVRHLAPERGV